MASLGARQDNENNTYTLDVDTEVAQRTLSSINLTTLFNLATIAGLTTGESFDEIDSSVDGSGNTVLSFNLAGACQFQLLFTLTSSTNFNILKRDCVFFLLQEDGDEILLEDGSNLLTEGAV